MTEKEIAHLERLFIQEAAEGKWTQGQAAAVRAFAARCYRAITAKLEQTTR